MSAPQPLPPVTASARRDDGSPPGDPCIQVLVVLRDLVARDHRLRGAQIRVLVYLIPELLDRRHRLVKQIVLARALRMDQGVISDSLRRLVKQGHLELGPREGSGNTYRLSTTLLSHFPYRKAESTTT